MLYCFYIDCLMKVLKNKHSCNVLLDFNNKIPQGKRSFLNLHIHIYINKGFNFNMNVINSAHTKKVSIKVILWVTTIRFSSITS